MTNKPQTLAEQIIAMEPPRGFGPASIMREGWNAAIIAAAALADAAATTTPVVGAEQACGVRQAVPEWGTSDKARHYAAMVADTNDADILRAAISDLCRDNERLTVMLKSAKQPDPTPALSRRAMQTFACEVISAFDEHDRQLCCNGRECGCQGATVHQAMCHDIMDYTGPTDAQALAEALKLPEVWPLVNAVRAYKEAQAAYSVLPSDRGSVGPKLEALNKALLCEGAMFAALAQIGGAA